MDDEEKNRLIEEVTRQAREAVMRGDPRVFRSVSDSANMTKQTVKRVMEMFNNIPDLTSDNDQSIRMLISEAIACDIMKKVIKDFLREIFEDTGMPQGARELIMTLIDDSGTQILQQMDVRGMTKDQLTKAKAKREDQPSDQSVQ